MSQQKFSLEEFVRAYVSFAFEQFKPKYQNIERLLIPLEVFESEIRKRAREKFVLNDEQLIYLHHAFHWAFFCDKKNEFKLVQKLNPGKRCYYVELNGGKSEDLAEYILNKYGNYLRERIKAIQAS